MPHIPKLRLRTLILIIAVFFAFLIGIGQFYTYSLFSNEVSKIHEARSVRLVESQITQTYTYSLAHQPLDIDLVQALTDKLVTTELLYAIEVRDKNNRIIAGSVDHSVPTKDGIKINRKSLNINHPELGHLGLIKASFTPYKAQHQLAMVNRAQIVIFSSIVLFIFLVMAAIVLTYERHVYSIQKAIKGIAKKDYRGASNKVPIKEFVETTRAVNKLSADLETSLAQMQKTDHLKANLIAMIWHDLRTPVNTIAPLLKIIHEQTEYKEIDVVTAEQIQICYDASKALLAVMDQLLDFNNLESGMLKVEEDAFHAYTLFDNVHSLYKGKKSLSINFTVTGEPNQNMSAHEKLVFTDQSKLTRILTNLLDNAFKYTLSGKIELKWCLDFTGDTPSLNFSVEDSGRGINPKNIERIFDEFYREHDDITGLGIGLTLVKRFVDTLNGKIDIESKQGIGTTVHVSIPVKLLAASPNTEQLDLKGEFKALVIDDIESNCFVLARLLELHGVESDCCIQALDALEILEQQQYDIIFLDYAMPEVTGIELARRVKELNLGIPVVCVTAHVEMHILEKISRCIRDEGAINHILKKPINSQQLENILIHLAETRANTEKLVDGVIEKLNLKL